MMNSEALFNEAAHVIPGGVNSPVRAFKGVGGTPVFFAKSAGAYLFDVEDKRYIDYVGSWGAAVLGHAHPTVINALGAVLQNGLGWGAPSVVETKLAEKITQLMPSIELVRMVNSGTEATMSAIRLARGYTKRDVIVKFEGCYHGHSDSLLVTAGSGALTLGKPNSSGVPDDFVKHTLSLTYNDLEQVKQAFAQQGERIAGVIIEPVCGNMNCVLPQADFLSGVRKLCDEYGSVLIFDEVMTGFRVALGGAQQVYDVVPDLTTLGKVIGGGLPVGAFGGKREIMKQLAPLGDVYQAGTLSGNPVSMTAGLATLNVLANDEDFFVRLSAKTTQLARGIIAAAAKHSIPMSANVMGGMFGLFFTQEDKVRDFATVKDCDIKNFQRFYHFMLKQGVYLAPSAFEAGFVSGAHSDEDIEHTIAVAKRSFAML